MAQWVLCSLAAQLHPVWQLVLHRSSTTRCSPDMCCDGCDTHPLLPKALLSVVAILVASHCGGRKRILCEQILTFAWDALVIGFILQDAL